MALMSGLLSACGTRQEPAQQMIQSRYDYFNEAWAGKDREKLEAVFTPECKFKQTDEGKILSLPQYMSAMEFSFRAMKVISVETQIESVQLNQDTAEVAASMDTEVKILSAETGTNGAESPATRSTHKVRDTWKKTANGWQIVYRLIEG